MINRMKVEGKHNYKIKTPEGKWLGNSREMSKWV